MGDLNKFQIKKGDILVLEGNIEFSQCELRIKRAIKIHVTIGYIGYKDGNIDELGWKIFRDKWTNNKTRSIFQSIIGCIKKSKSNSTETMIELHNFNTIRAYPAEYFPGKQTKALWLKKKSY